MGDLEVWKPVVGYEGLYEVSNLGRVRSLPKYHTKEIVYLHLTKNPRDGRLSVMLVKDKQRKRIAVHRLVAFAFIENTNPEVFTDVNHKDENPENNNVNNLEWCDHAQNMRHSYEKITRSLKRTPVVGYDERGIAFQFESQMEAKREGYHVSHYLGKEQKYKGFYWRYANE